jgi:hypothetical protein
VSRLPNGGRRKKLKQAIESLLERNVFPTPRKICHEMKRASFLNCGEHFMRHEILVELGAIDKSKANPYWKPK